MPEQLVMDRQEYENERLDEKAGLIDDEINFSSQEPHTLCKAHLRSVRWQGFKNIVCLLLFGCLWKSWTLIPSQLSWRGHDIVEGAQEGHSSFDTVRCQMSKFNVRC